MAVTNARVVANYFLYLSNEHGDLLTQLKLQKLVYYADAWHLVHFNESLISEDFEAWVHGPVVRSLYSCFATFKWQPIQVPVEQPDNLSDDKKEFLQDVFQYFSKFTAYELEQMTHMEKPWLEAREGVPTGEASTNIINKDTMLSFYSQM